MGQNSVVAKNTVPEVPKVPSEPVIVDISDIDKVELLKQLTLASPPHKKFFTNCIGGYSRDEENFIHDTRPNFDQLEYEYSYKEIDDRKAQRDISKGFIFEFYDKTILADLRGTEVDATQYDGIVGKGKFAKIVQEIREKSITRAI